MESLSQVIISVLIGSCNILAHCNLDYHAHSSGILVRKALALSLHSSCHWTPFTPMGSSSSVKQPSLNADNDNDVSYLWKSIIAAPRWSHQQSPAQLKVSLVNRSHRTVLVNHFPSDLERQRAIGFTDRAPQKRSWWSMMKLLEGYASSYCQETALL